MPNLTYKQKTEIAINYLTKNNISFGNSMADEKAIDLIVFGLTHNEEKYLHTIDEFKDAWINILKASWDEMWKYVELQNKIVSENKK